MMSGSREIVACFIAADYAFGALARNDIVLVGYYPATRSQLISARAAV
jgi:hypothetical protein